eukprot:2817880-Rhodomonas_salina.2
MDMIDSSWADWTGSRANELDMRQPPGQVFAFRTRAGAVVDVRTVDLQHKQTQMPFSTGLRFSVTSMPCVRKHLRPLRALNPRPQPHAHTGNPCTLSVAPHSMKNCTRRPGGSSTDWTRSFTFSPVKNRCAPHPPSVAVRPRPPFV